MLMTHKRFANTLVLTFIPWILCIKALELKRISVREVTAVEGGKASLPCDVKHPSDDSVFLVLWFNDNLTTPIYSYDVRPAVRDAVSHWKDNTVLGDRAKLVVSERYAELQLSPVAERDEGFYKCRVDFRQHPTRTTRISLKVIVPPKSLVITKDGVPVTSVIGPFQEGESTTLKCTAFEGRPPPKVYWYFGDHIIDDEMDNQEVNEIQKEATLDRKLRSLPQWKLRKNGRKVSNTLSLGPFDRNDLKKLVTCEATNTNISTPISEAVMVDMNLPPLGIEISGPTEPVSAGKKYELICQVFGSRPPPLISWLRGTTRVQGDTESTSTDGNITRSSLTLIPTPPDDGTTITCRARNQATDTNIQRSVALSVNFVPEAVITLANFLNKDKIKEGDDVYFECKITANPKVYKITWQQNGRTLEPNITAGIIMSNQSLVLQRVRRKHAGRYSCTASNIEGDGLASFVTLDIKYAPVCDPNQVTTYGVAKKEDAEVICKIDANPPAKSFKWTFNNTADTIDVPPGRYTTTPQSSIITYTPVTELDFGTLLCWAANNIGTQATPCVFHIVPAGRPDPPTNCSIVNKTSSSFGVWCQSGFDGGLHQVFLIRASKVGDRGGVNYTNGEPIFLVENLTPGHSYRLQVWAANDKGSSVPVHLNAFTLNAPPHNPSHGPSEAEVRKGSVNRESSGNLSGSSSTSSEATNNHLSNDKMQSTREWEWQVSGIIPLIAGTIAGGVLILFVTGLLIRYKLRRRRNGGGGTPGGGHEGEADDNSHLQCQSSSASMLLHSRHHSDGSTVCDKREHQIEPEDAFERDQVPGVDVDASGPLIQPPLTYAEDGSKGCYRHLQDQESSPHHSLISHLHEKGGIVTFHSTTANPGCFAPRHPPPSSQQNLIHQHILQRPHPNSQASDFGVVDMRTSSLTPPLARPTYPKDVPTVYATLGNRGSRQFSVGTHMMRSAHSQANIDIPYEQDTTMLPRNVPRGLGMQGQRVDVANATGYNSAKQGKDVRFHKDMSRPLLDDPKSKGDKDPLNKRESSV